MIKYLKKTLKLLRDRKSQLIEKIKNKIQMMMQAQILIEYYI